uniref:Uncharacterized protein n=1 Tax=Trichuris muris TaxID=70415 RepID=A0A5S6R0T4_TRIMR
MCLFSESLCHVCLCALGLITRVESIRIDASSFLNFLFTLTSRSNFLMCVTGTKWRYTNMTTFQIMISFSPLMFERSNVRRESEGSIKANKVLGCLPRRISAGDKPDVSVLASFFIVVLKVRTNLSAIPLDAG